MAIMTARRGAFKVGERVELHPASNPGISDIHLADKGTVMSCVPSKEMKHLDIVGVLWDSKLRAADAHERDKDLPVSALVVKHVSIRLRRVNRGEGLQ